MGWGCVCVAGGGKGSGRGGEVEEGGGVGLGAVILVSAVAFITECTDDSRFRQLLRLNKQFVSDSTF